MNNNIKEITILHTNDIHGQLNFTVGKDFTVHGGISLLSGYINKVREEKDVFLGICGDILQEDIRGSDYKGTNTVELINYLEPDALSLGNHELDYGLAHLLIFETCFKSPLLCANILISNLEQMLFEPSRIYNVGGVRMLVIGIIPEAFFNRVLTDEFCRSMLTYKDTYEAIRDEIDAHKDEHVDLVVLMSHYGIEGDRALAENMPDDIHIDLLLGGHSHILMKEAEVINGIPIAQSSYGTVDIGRFDLKVDTESKKLLSWDWNLVEISESTSSFDYGVDDLADRVVFNKKVQYNSSKVCQFKETYTQKSRLFESDLGNLVSDAFADLYPVDFVILQSGSLRQEACGPIMTEKDFNALYPFDDKFYVCKLTGKEIRDGFNYLFSLKPDGSIMGGTFQYSKGFRIEVDGDDCWNKGCVVEKIMIHDKELDDNKTYNVGLTKNCVKGFMKYFSLDIPEENKNLVSLSTYHDLVGYYLRYDGIVEAPKKGRFIFKNFKWPES